MSISNLVEKINQLKMDFELIQGDQCQNIHLEKLSDREIEELKMLRELPYDMFLILCHVGCMRQWSKGSAAVIEWWIPCSIEKAMHDNRCPYELSPENFINDKDLLFFAWDCDAKCYFYDVSFTPWKLVICCALDSAMYNGNQDYYGDKYINCAVLYEDSFSRTALSVIRQWLKG